MKNQQSSDLYQRLESVDPLNAEPMPAGWSRRNWVQREAVALAAVTTGRFIVPKFEPEDSP